MRAGTTIQTIIEGSCLPGITRAIVLLVLVIISTVSAKAASPGGFGEDDMTRMKRGEILLQTIHPDKPGAAARVSALLHTNASEVWNIMGYCEYELIYVKGLKVCEMLEGDQFQMIVHHRLKHNWYTPALDFIFSARRRSDESGNASLVSGNLRVFEGQWNFYPLIDDDSVIVVHEVRIQPRIPAPKWLVRRSLQKDLPDMLACIRGLASASGTESLVLRDLKRCPGDISDRVK